MSDRQHIFSNYNTATCWCGERHIAPSSAAAPSSVPSREPKICAPGCARVANHPDECVDMYDRTLAAPSLSSLGPQDDEPTSEEELDYIAEWADKNWITATSRKAAAEIRRLRTELQTAKDMNTALEERMMMGRR